MTNKMQKQKISGEEAKTILIAGVINLIETIPFSEITARRIAAEVQMDPNVIFRQFGDLNGLFVATLRAMASEVLGAVAEPSSNEKEALNPVDYTAMYLRFHEWLLLSGVSPEAIAVDSHTADELRRLTFERIDVDPDLSDRSKQAIFGLVMSFVQAQAVQIPFQPNAFPEGSDADIAILLAALIERLPVISKELGWDDEEVSPL